MKPHAYLNDGLLLRGEVLFYILLQSSQHHGLQNALKFLNLRHPKTQFHSENSGKTKGMKTNFTSKKQIVALPVLQS